MSFNINSAIQSRTAILTDISNYSQWSRQVRSLLTMAGWWSIVDGTSLHAAQPDAATQATWISHDQQAQAMIAIFIHADLQHYQKEAYVPIGNVTHPSMARDLWQELQKLFAPTGATGQYDAFIEGDNFHIHESKDIPSQINNLVNTFHKMSIAGLTLSENLKAMILLNSLPNSYKSVVSTIVQTTTTANFTMEHMIPLIIAESQLRHSTSHRRALVNRLDQQLPTHEVNQTSTIQRAPHSTTVCDHCGKGHPSDRCWAKYGRPGQRSNNPRGGHRSSSRPTQPHGSAGHHHSQNNQGQRPSRGRGGPHGRKPFKGKACANEVDGIANAVEMNNEDMNVDSTYQIGENKFLDDEGMHEHWDEDQVYVPVEEEPVAGPSCPFCFGSLPHSL